MASKSDKYTPQQYKKYNGQSVFKALSAIGSEASADELANFISQDIGQREETLLPEVQQVLRRGIANGFLVKNGDYYSFIGNNLEMHLDSARSRRPHSSSRKSVTPNRVQLVRRNYEEGEEGSEDEESEENGSEQEDFEGMETDSVPTVRPIVKLYEIYNPPESQSEDEDSEQYYEDEPPQKRIRLQLDPHLKPNFLK